MALLGSNIDPRLFVQDYSGFTRAADIQGQSMQNLGQQIAGGIEQVGDYFKQQGEKKKLIKKSDIQIDAALKLFPDLAPTLQGVRDQIKDENISLDERAGIAESVAGLINMGTNQMQSMAEFGLKKRELDIQQGQAIQEALMKRAELQAEARRPVEMKLGKFVVGETELDVLTDKFGKIYDPQSRLEIIDIPGYADGKPLEQVTKLGASLGPPPPDFPTPDFPLPVGNSVNNGEVLPSLERAGVPTLTAEQQAIVDAEGAAYPDGVSITGTPLEGATPPVATERAIEQRVAELAGPTYTPIPQPRSADAIQKAADLTEQAPVSAFAPRGRQIKQGTESKETEMTLEQVQSLVAQGFKVNARPTPKGTFMVSGADIGGQAGETIETTSEGGVKITRGGSGAKAAQVAEEAKKQSFERSRAIIGSAAKILPEIKSGLSANPLIARVQQTLSEVLPAGETGRIGSELETIRTQTSKEEIGKMRASSPTGSAGGSITEKEWPKFEDRFGKMVVGMNPNDLVSNVQKTALNQFESVNGTPEDVIKLFSNGKITKPVFDEYIKEYKQTRSILGISDAGTGGPGDDWTKYNPNLLRFDKEKQNQLSPEAQSLQDRLDALKSNP